MLTMGLTYPTIAQITGATSNLNRPCEAGFPGCAGTPIAQIMPQILSITPSYRAVPSSSVIIKGSVNLTGATAVYFGSQSVQFTVQADGTICASAPDGKPGSAVGVSVELGGQLLPSTATFTYPIAELDVTGPLPWDQGVLGTTPGTTAGRPLAIV